MIVETIRHRVEVAPGEERFDALEELRIDRERIGEGAVNRARLLDHDLAVPFEDGCRDLADVLIDQRFDRLFTRENARARLAHAGGTERVGRSRPSERRTGSLAALHERRRRPPRLKRFPLEPPVDGLKYRPREPSASCQRQLDRLPKAHTTSPPTPTIARPSRDGPRLKRRQNHSTVDQRARSTCARTSSWSARSSIFPLCRHRQPVDEDDDSRDLVRRQPPGAVLPDSRQRQTGRARDDRRDLLSARQVGGRHHARIGDAVHLPQNALDLTRLHLASRDVDER